MGSLNYAFHTPGVTTFISSDRHGIKAPNITVNIFTHLYSPKSTVAANNIKKTKKES